jgi:hypothetical protein
MMSRPPITIAMATGRPEIELSLDRVRKIEKSSRVAG